MKLNNSMLFYETLFVICLVVFSSKAWAMEKARVAIQQINVADSVNAYHKKYLGKSKSILISEMESAFLATGKFEVLTHNKENMKMIRNEQKYAQSELTAGNAAKSGLLENADYLVVATIQDFAFIRSDKAIPNISNKYTRIDSGRIKIDAQILDTQTQAIKGNFPLEDRFSTKEQIVNSKGGIPSKTYFLKMAKKISTQMAYRLVNKVFPMRVMQVVGKQCFISQGEDGGIKKGDSLIIFRPGPDLIDPYTQEKIGSAEIELGIIKVTRVNPKSTIAKFDPQKMEDTIQIGDIVRKP